MTTEENDNNTYELDWETRQYRKTYELLPRKKDVKFKRKRTSTIDVTVFEGRKFNTEMEMFVKLRVGESSRQTNTSYKTSNPKFKENDREFSFSVLDTSKKQSVIVRVYDQITVFLNY
jgi:hypothetical protein